MTRAGIAFILGGVVLYVLAGETQIGWFYLIDAMIWGVVALSIVVPWWTVSTLSVDRRVWPRGSRPLDQVPASTEGDIVDVRLLVANRGRFARHFVRVMEECPMEAPGRRTRSFAISSVQAGGSVEFSYTAACYQRGRYAQSTATLEMGAPLGLFVFRRRFDIPLDLTVYPAYREIDSMSKTEDGATVSGDTVVAAAPDFHGSREYQYGDPLRHIHWRNTARLAKFVVKEFEGAGQAPVAVAFPTDRVWGDGRDTTLEYSIRIAASVGWLKRPGDARPDRDALRPVEPHGLWDLVSPSAGRLRSPGPCRRRDGLRR